MGKYVDEIVKELKTRGDQFPLEEKDITIIKKILFEQFVQNRNDTIPVLRGYYDVGFGFRTEGYNAPTMVAQGNKFHAFLQWLKKNGFTYHRKEAYEGYITFMYN